MVEERIKAVGLMSGGLDSVLALKIVSMQGIDVYAYNLKTIFWGRGGQSFAGDHSEFSAAKPADEERRSPYMTPRESAELIGVNYEEEEVSADFIELVKKPSFGYGSNMNPCIDCKVFFMKKAKEYMEEIGAKFIFTGEVLGQRPMTQNAQNMKRMIKIAGIEDICLRPLSAKLLEPTLPEREGWIDRDRLYAISGRGRSEQVRLAEIFGIKNYPPPAGGCMLTDPNYAGRLYDLVKSGGDFGINDILLLKNGRHFRLGQDIKCVVGRNEKDNVVMANLAGDGDILLEPLTDPGPLVMLRGKDAEKYIEAGASLCKRYSDGKNKASITVKYLRCGVSDTPMTIEAGDVPDDFLRDKLVRSFDE